MSQPTCRDCGVATGKRYARYCDAHRWQHRVKPAIYRLTPERETYLRAHYKPLDRGMSTRIATVLRVPKWRVCRWAADLGLTSGMYRFGLPAWTPQDDAFLEQHLPTRTINWIAKQLRRTPTACQVRAKRIGLSRKDGRDWYTARQVGDGFGVDPTTVVHWIERGWLKGTHYGADHPGGRAAMWRITHNALRAFVKDYQGAYVLAKVDQLWFLDLVFTRVQQRETAA